MTENKEAKLILPNEAIMRKILLIRGERVMIDTDLAELYAVPTKRLNEQVKRNIKRFPKHFMFELTKEEKDELVAKCDHLKMPNILHFYRMYLHNTEYYKLQIFLTQTEQY